MIKFKKIIIIMTDTWRRDHFGFYGNEKIKTPNLDRFSKECVVFDRCYANSYPTGPARADLLTGQYTYMKKDWRSRAGLLLSQIIERQKFTTAAIGDWLLHKEGFQNYILIRGQHEERDTNFDIRYESDYISPRTMIEASKWLERHYKENFFLYIDTWDPHEPWNFPRWYGEYYYPGYDGKYHSAPYWYYKEAGLTEEDVRKGHAAYCAEITMLDRWIGHLLDSIEGMNLMDETAIVFTSDHGFYFGEHGIYGKNLFPFTQLFLTEKKPLRYRYSSPLYEEDAGIPLIIHLPDVKHKIIEDVVGLADTMPTILELMGIEIPQTTQSQSLVPLLYGEDQKKRRDFVITSNILENPEENPREAGLKEWQIATITTKEWSLLYAAEGQPVELYHLPSDPKQERNLIEERSDIAQDLLKKFVSHLEDFKTEPFLLNPRRRF